MYIVTVTFINEVVETYLVHADTYFTAVQRARLHYSPESTMVESESVAGVNWLGDGKVARATPFIEI